MIASIEFQQPAPLMSMNDRPHWAARARQVKTWRTAACAAADASPHRLLPPALVELHLPVPDSRRRDPMNYAPTMKACVDGLVDAGVWPDDTPEFVRTLEPTLYVVGRNITRTVRIVITERGDW